ncbi:unnamed protein product [Echinostoma caproni]|uniref:CUE domain-containing protein n=1 Tax=Echinostoma caproni TaxID=27848 RepID=A0A183B9S7_9TREM|nr:unnamed protein product [Echinostoma caproni]
MISFPLIRLYLLKAAIFGSLSFHVFSHFLVEANGDVDTAIDFLLSSADADGKDSTLSDSSAVTKPSNTSLVAPSRLKTAAETFHASSTARQLSLTERRQALLSHARKRFLVTSNPEDRAE